MVTISAPTPSAVVPSYEGVRPGSNPFGDERPSGFPSCLRCDTRLMTGYFEPQCPTCGYVDYSNTPKTAPGKASGIISTATRYVLRYVGEFSTLAETLAHVRLVRVRNRVVFAVNCPFCEKAMDQSSLSGKRHEPREQRYKCIDGHRVSLVPCENDVSLGWK